jgi:hypothetical protein
MDVLGNAPFTGSLTKAGLAVGTTTTLTQTLGAADTANLIVIKGKTYSVAALSNTATPTTDWATGVAFLPVGVNFGSIFMVGFSAAGGLKAIQGQIVALDASGNFLTAPQFGGTSPPGSAPGAGGSGDFCPIAYVTVKVGSTGAAWTFGTTNFAGPPTGVTFAFQDVCGWPDRAQIA